MPNRFFLVLLVAVLACTLSGCPKGAYHNAVIVEHDFTTSLNSFQQAVKTEHTNSRISDAENQALEGAILKIANAATIVNQSLAAGATQPTVFGQLTILVDAVSDAKTNVIGHLSNQTAEVALTAGIGAVGDLLKNLQTQLASTGATANATK